MYKGSCLCGKVRFEITGKIEDIVCCHCSLCRKAQGSAFATNGNLDANKFTITDGNELLTAYEVTPGQTKYFCKTCGSPISGSSAEYPNKVRVRLGTIESDISEKPVAHIFVASKANWEDINDELPQHDEVIPG